MVKNVFYFTLKALSVLKTFKALSRRFGFVEKRHVDRDKANFKIYDAGNKKLQYIHCPRYLTK